MRSHVFALALLLAVPFACAQTSDAAKPEPATIEERWGIQVVALRLSAAGRLLDFRYTVLDADKAKPLSSRQSKPYLEADGKRYPVFNAPRVGPLRSTYQPEPGKVYGIMFVNEYQALKPGDQVSVVIGDFRVDNLTIE